MFNAKGIFKSIIAGATIIGGAVLGLEAKKCFTKPVTDEESLDEMNEETTEATAEDPAEEEAEEDGPEEIPED